MTAEQPAPQAHARGLRSLLRCDAQAAGLPAWRLAVQLPTLSSFWLVVLHRVARRLQEAGVPGLPALASAVGRTLYAADISPGARLGGGLRIPHTVGIVIGWDVVAGDRLTVFQNVTLGGRTTSVDGRWTPLIGDDVTIYAGAAVLGPVRIGDGAVIGAHALVVDDVAAGTAVAGNPARPITAPRAAGADRRTC